MHSKGGQNLESARSKLLTLNDDLRWKLMLGLARSSCEHFLTCLIYWNSCCLNSRKKVSENGEKLPSHKPEITTNFIHIAWTPNEVLYWMVYCWMIFNEMNYAKWTHVQTIASVCDRGLFSKEKPSKLANCWDSFWVEYIITANNTCNFFLFDSKIRAKADFKTNRFKQFACYLSPQFAI